MCLVFGAMAMRCRRELGAIVVMVLLLGSLAGHHLFSTSQRKTANFGDGRWVLRVCAVCAAAGLLQGALWRAGRQERRAQREAFLDGRFYHYVPRKPARHGSNRPAIGRAQMLDARDEDGRARTLARAPRDEDGGPHVETDFAIRIDPGLGGRCSVVARFWGTGLKHRVIITGGAIKIAPGDAERLFGAQLTRRVAELGIRFPSLRGGTEADALLLEVPFVELAGAAACVESLRTVGRDLVRTLDELAVRSTGQGGYRGPRQHGDGGTEGQLTTLFAPLDDGSVIALAAERIAEVKTVSRPRRAVFALLGTAVVAIGLSLYTGAADRALCWTTRGRWFESLKPKELTSTIIQATTIAAIGVALQAIAASGPLRSGTPTRAQKFATVTIGILIACGYGSCLAVGPAR